MPFFQVEFLTSSVQKTNCFLMSQTNKNKCINATEIGFAEYCFKQIEDIRTQTYKQVSLYKADFVSLHQRKWATAWRVLLPVDRGARGDGERRGEEGWGGPETDIGNGKDGGARAAERIHYIICVPLFCLSSYSLVWLVWPWCSRSSACSCWTLGNEASVYK